MVSMHATEKQTWFITACFSILWLWLNVFLLHTGANSDFHSKEEKIFKYNLVLQRGWLWQHFFPLIDACNRKWCRTRDGWIISGFVASTLVLVVAGIEFIILILTQIHQKQVVRYYLNFDFRIKCDTCVHFLFKYLCNLNGGLVTIFYYPAHACLKYK